MNYSDSNAIDSKFPFIPVFPKSYVFFSLLSCIYPFNILRFYTVSSTFFKTAHTKVINTSDLPYEKDMSPCLGQHHLMLLPFLRRVSSPELPDIAFTWFSFLLNLHCQFLLPCSSCPCLFALHLFQYLVLIPVHCYVFISNFAILISWFQCYLVARTGIFNRLCPLRFNFMNPT